VNVLDLFSGIGGFSLGLERAGMRTVAFCEREPYARAVLAKHWPGVPCYTDVCDLTAARLVADGIRVDAICGGFPCTDISTAGRGAGIDGEQSGLWREYARLVGELRPRYVLVENVAALLARGLERVLGDLATLGYDAEWHCIPASYIGAPHRRDRIWVVAYPSSQPGYGGEDYPGERMEAQSQPEPRDRRGPADVAYAIGQRQPGSWEPIDASHPEAGAIGKAVDALHGGFRSVWAVEPDVGRVADGIRSRVDRLRCLGNSVVPQIPEMLGHAIMLADEATGAT
jgi:DNA (cytosine-5)-methyltransferase 1